MDKRTLGIIGLIVAILFCGLPGLCGFCAGPIYIFAGLVPGSDINIFGSTDPSAAIGYGVGTICLSVIFIAVPVAVWFFALKKQNGAADDVIEGEEISIPDEDI